MKRCTFALLLVAACAPEPLPRSAVLLQAGAAVCVSREALSDAIQAGWETPACRTLPADVHATIVSEERGELQVRIQGEGADVFVQARSIER